MLPGRAMGTLGLFSENIGSAPFRLPASVAVGLLVVGADGLYVVRMRRG